MVPWNILITVPQKLTELKTTNNKLTELYEQAENTEATEQFQTTLDQESEFIDN